MAQTTRFRDFDRRQCGLLNAQRVKIRWRRHRFEDESVL